MRGEREGLHCIVVAIHGLSFSACDWHPSLADETIIADKLIQAIDADQTVWTKQ